MRRWRETAHDREAIAEIVRRLDGVPLAIELAAARMSLLSPAKILARLEKQIDLLSPVTGGRPDRLSTLRATIEWSWALLDPQERTTLAQLSTFRNGFTLEAAEAVVDLSAHGGEAHWIGDILQALREKSLVTVADDAEDGELRFRLLEGIRCFAVEKLEEAGSTESSRRRHGEFFVTLCRPLARRAEAGGARCLALLARERENLLAIPRWTTSSATPTGDDVGLALEAVLCLDPLLSTRGPFDAHLSLLDATIALSERTSGVPLGLLARAHHARAEARRTRGRFAESVADCRRALSLARTAGDRWVEGRVLWNLGAVADSEGRLDDAMDLLHRALELQQEVGDRSAQGRSYGLLGVITFWLARYDEARAHLEHAQAVLHEQGDLYAAVFLGCLAALNQETGALNEARLQYERAIAALREAGARRHVGMFLGYLGGLEWEQNRTEEARRRLNEALAIAREVGAKMYVALFLATIAAIDADDDLLPAASRGFDAAEAILNEVGSRDEPYRTAIELHRGHLDLALSRRAELVGPGEEAAARRVAVSRRLDAVSKCATERPPSPVQRSDDVRFALRMLKGALEL